MLRHSFVELEFDMSMTIAALQHCRPDLEPMEMTEALFRAVSEFNSGKFEDDLTVLPRRQVISRGFLPESAADFLFRSRAAPSTGSCAETAPSIPAMLP